MTGIHVSTFWKKFQGSYIMFNFPQVSRRQETFVGKCNVVDWLRSVLWGWAWQCFISHLALKYFEVNGWAEGRLSFKPSRTAAEVPGGLAGNTGPTDEGTSSRTIPMELGWCPGWSGEKFLLHSLVKRLQWDGACKRPAQGSPAPSLSPGWVSTEAPHYPPLKIWSDNHTYLCSENELRPNKNLWAQLVLTTNKKNLFFFAKFSKPVSASEWPGGGGVGGLGVKHGHTWVPLPRGVLKEARWRGAGV